MWLRAFPFVVLLVASNAGCANNSGFDGEPPTTGGGGSASGGQGGAGGTGGFGGSGGTGGVIDDMCEEDPCRLIAPQCGCGDGLKCTVNSTDGRICTADGMKNEGEQCTDAAPCAAGLLCVQTKTTVPTISTCMEFCNDDVQCEGPGGFCNVTVGVDGVILCSQSCDPVLDTGCPVNKTHCEVVQEAAGQLRTYTRCVGEGAGGPGDPCTTSQDCTAGHGCLLDSNLAELVCLEWCKVGGDPCIQGTCTSVNPPYLVDAVEYGVCL